jgi:O-antigen ligase
MANVNKREQTPIHDVVTTWIPTLTLSVTIFFWTPGFDAFNFSKQAVLLAGIGALFVFYILGSRKIKLTNVEYFLIISVVLVCVLTTISSGMENRYWWGVFSRANGNLTNVAFLLLTLIITTYFSSKLVNRIYFIALVALVLQCIYGLIQYFRLDPIPWENPHSPVITFFGNPNFSAASFGFLAIAIFRYLDISELKSGRIGIRNVALSVVFLLSVFLNYQTKSIQGLATLALGAYVFLGLNYLFGVREFRMKALLRFAYLLFPILIGIGFAGKGPLGAKIKQETFLNRLEYWRIAFHIIKDFPLFGIGPDGYSQFYQLYRSPEYTVRYGTGLSSSAAHNVLLQWGTNYGLAGIAIYGFLIVLCLRRFLLINKRVQSTDKVLFQITFTLWITYQATALISIEQIGVAIWGWIFTGIILGWSNKFIEQGDFKTAHFSSSANSRVISSGLDGFVFLTALVLAFPSTIHLRQDLALRKAVQLPGISAGVQGSDLEARGKRIYQAALPLYQDKDYFQFAVMSLYQEGPASVGQEFAMYSLKEDSRNTQAIEAIAIAESNLKNWTQVIKYRKMLQVLDPQNYLNDARIGEALYNLGNKSQALEVLTFANAKSKDDPAMETYRQLQVLIQEELD